MSRSRCGGGVSLVPKLVLPSDGRRPMRRRRRRRARILITSRFAMAAASPGRLFRDNNIKPPPPPLSSQCRRTPRGSPPPKALLSSSLRRWPWRRVKLFTIIQRGKEKENNFVDCTVDVKFFRFFFFFFSGTLRKNKASTLFSCIKYIW